MYGGSERGCCAVLVGVLVSVLRVCVKRIYRRNIAGGCVLGPGPSLHVQGPEIAVVVKLV